MNKAFVVFTVVLSWVVAGIPESVTQQIAFGHGVIPILQSASQIQASSDLQCARSESR
jgi:hypothetical protein